MKYTGGLTIELFLPSGPHIVAAGDTLKDLTAGDIKALSSRPDFQKTGGKSPKPSTEEGAS